MWTFIDTRPTPSNATITWSVSDTSKAELVVKDGATYLKATTATVTSTTTSSITLTGTAKKADGTTKKATASVIIYAPAVSLFVRTYPAANSYSPTIATTLTLTAAVDKESWVNSWIDIYATRSDGTKTPYYGRINVESSNTSVVASGFEGYQEAYKREVDYYCSQYYNIEGTGTTKLTFFASSPTSPYPAIYRNNKRVEGTLTVTINGAVINGAVINGAVP
jgi:hypothetical protein